MSNIIMFTVLSVEGTGELGDKGCAENGKKDGMPVIIGGGGRDESSVGGVWPFPSMSSSSVTSGSFCCCCCCCCC